MWKCPKVALKFHHFLPPGNDHLFMQLRPFGASLAQWPTQLRGRTRPSCLAAFEVRHCGKSTCDQLVQLMLGKSQPVEMLFDKAARLRVDSDSRAGGYLRYVGVFIRVECISECRIVHSVQVQILIVAVLVTCECITCRVHIHIIEITPKVVII